MTGEKSEEHKAERDNLGRDIKILDEFEFADYLMKDVLGYFQYVNASVQSASPEDKISRLPEKVLPFTRGWVITYSPKILVKQMDEKFQFYHTRSSLIVLVAIFEVALRSFAAHLNENEHDSIFKGINPELGGYKTLLERAFDFVIPNKESIYSGGYKEAINRLPEVCLDVDEARRLRNLFMHHRGLFHESYEKQAIPINGNIKLHPQYLKFRKNPEQKVPVLLTHEEYISYSCSHNELLHELHDLIQRKYFGLTDSGYYYPREQPRLKPKIAELDRIFTGK
ncbi:MAG: hypothetical protein E3J91_01450 [Hadesarchaea archaeon]|nr:MAG: hypothetical protein E3J91_01450 [Hadesarchaea archaeon]